METDWKGLAELYKKAYNIRVELTYIRSDDLDDLMYPCEKCLCLHGRRSYLKDKVIKTCSICSVAKCDISFKYILATKEIKGVNQGETEIIRSDDCCETCLPKLDHICSECIVNGRANELINDFIVCDQGCCFMCLHEDPEDHYCENFNELSNQIYRVKRIID